MKKESAGTAVKMDQFQQPFDHRPLVFSGSVGCNLF
jgi:hypothetical protein